MNSLVYIMYNKKLKHKHLMKQSSKEEDDPLIIETLPSNDEWVANPDDDEEDGTRVLDINDMIQLEENVGESSRRPKKGKRNRRS